MNAVDILIFSNGNGEDEIARLVIEKLAPDPASRARLQAWPMVGTGSAYARAGVDTFGPRNALPSEGFGTVSLPAFLRDLRAGFFGTYLSQARFARSLKGGARAVLAIGDIVPLAAAWLTGLPTMFFSSAKSARYGGTDGHNALERALMRRVSQVFVRDERTARMLGVNGVAVRFVGNPMMDGVAGADGSKLRDPSRTNLALIPGTRADASENAGLLMAALAAAGGGHHGILAAAPDFAAGDFDGWTGSGNLTHPSGATAEIAPGRFAEALAAADIAIGMAGTGNEQAVGLGLPLIAVPGAGNQNAAFTAMKARYFGKAALSVPRDVQAIADAVARLTADASLCAAMGEAGRSLMGAPGASASIAAALGTLAGWEAAL